MARSPGPVGGKSALVRGREELGHPYRVGIADRECVEEAVVRVVPSVGERARQGVHEDERATVANRKCVTPQAERVAEDDSRGRHGVQRLARHVRPDPGHTDDECVERLADMDPSQLDRANERLRMCDRRAPGKDRRRCERAVLVAQDVAAQRRREERVQATER